jgi:hypothetical protein
VLCCGCFAAHVAKLLLSQKLSINWPCAANEENGDAWLLRDTRKQNAGSRINIHGLQHPGDDSYMQRFKYL